MSIREIPAPQWREFLQSFGIEHRAWLATIGSVARAGDCTRIQFRAAPRSELLDGHPPARSRHSEGFQPIGGRAMPEKETLKRARQDKRAGKAPTTQAGEFVREEIHHVREGKHGARSTKQAIAIGLSKARRAGVKLGKPPKSAKASTRRSAASASRAGGHAKRRPAARRSRATRAALEREPRSAVSRKALARQATSAARRRSAAARRAAARRAVRTKGPRARRAAARQAARTRQKRRRTAA
jgi:hypothetical protein